MAATLENIFDEVVRLNTKLDALPSLIEISGNQVRVTSLNELSETLGLVMAGEFRAGNLRVPGDSFSGIRIAYPPLYYPSTSTLSSDLYNIAGVDADTLQVGIGASDGVLYAGAGNVWLNVDGVNIYGGLFARNVVQWWTNDTDFSASDETVAIIRVAPDTISSDSGELSVRLSMRAGANLDDTAGVAAQIDRSIVSLVAFSADSSGGTADVGYSELQVARTSPGVDDAVGNFFALRFNEQLTGGGAEITDIFRIERNQYSTAQLFHMITSDAGSAFTGIVINEAANDYDLRFEGLTVDDVFFLDAAANSIVFGGQSTADLLIGVLNESAVTFNSTATAGIEDPDNEMGKLWLDTNFEMRLTDTAGEDWFVTKSTSTGGAHNYSVNVFSTGFRATLSNTVEAITHGGERWDIGGLHDPVTNNSRLTVPAGGAGIWGVWFNIQEDVRSAVGNRLWFRAGINGTFTRGVEASPASTANYPAHNFYSEFDLSSGDYVEVLMNALISTDDGIFPGSDFSGFGMDWLRSTP